MLSTSDSLINQWCSYTPGVLAQNYSVCSWNQMQPAICGRVHLSACNNSRVDNKSRPEWLIQWLEHCCHILLTDETQILFTKLGLGPLEHCYHILLIFRSLLVDGFLAFQRKYVSFIALIMWAAGHRNGNATAVRAYEWKVVERWNRTHLKLGGSITDHR